MKINIHYDVNQPKNSIYELTDLESITTNSLNEALLKAAQQTKQNISDLGLNKAAVCLSGIDSELIVHYLCEAGVDVEAYTLNLDNCFDYEIKTSEQICKKYNINFKEIKVSADELIDTKFVDFIFHTNYAITTTFNYVPYLYQFIPDNHYIIGGDGSINRKFDKFRFIWINYLDIDIDINNNFYIPISYDNHAALQITIDKFKRHGNALWYSSCWDIWYHMLRHPKLETDGFFYYNTRNFLHEDLKFINPIHTRKTLPVDTPGGLKASFKILKKLRSLANSLPHYAFNAGKILTIPKISLNL